MTSCSCLPSDRSFRGYSQAIQADKLEPKPTISGGSRPTSAAVEQARGKRYADDPSATVFHQIVAHTDDPGVRVAAPDTRECFGRVQIPHRCFSGSPTHARYSQQHQLTASFPIAQEPVKKFGSRDLSRHRVPTTMASESLATQWPHCHLCLSLLGARHTISSRHRRRKQ